MAEQDPLPFVSVVIPTYNRKDSLLRTLDSLARQTYPADRFEVIVVDDGSSDGTEEVAGQHYPFRLRYVCQANRGATVARNHGAELAQGEYLVFVDDDIELSANAVQALVTDLVSQTRTIVLGVLRTPSQTSQVADDRSELLEQGLRRPAHDKGEYVPFQACMTGLLAVTHQAFYELGMFQDPTGGWPNWDDVDFGYRASQKGYRFWRSRAAVALHWDYAAADLRAAAGRWYRASQAAPRLFQTHPGLHGQIPMFRDKGPIAWREDPPRLILRKLARQIASSPPVLWAMERSVPLLKRHAPDSKLLALFYRWIIGGYIYRGYREGLQELRRRA